MEAFVEETMDFQEVDVFTDFVMLVVPKVGQESARWKYDARKDEQTLTVYRLSYENRIAAVSDCLSLQFCSEPSNPFAYSLYPTYTSGGIKTEPDFIQELLGKSVLTSPADIQTLLDRLDSDFQDNNLAAQNDELETEQASHYPEFFELERESSAESIAGSSEEDDEGDESDVGSNVGSNVASELSVEVELEDGASSSLRRSKRISGIEAEKLVKRVKQKRSTEESALLPPALKKVKTFGNFGSSKSKKYDKVKESQVNSLVFDDIPSLPAHPSSGRTIVSSQYWTLPADDRTKLNCGKEIFVDNGTLGSLPDLTKVPEEEHYVESVKYGWLLVEHLLGGSEAVSRSFAYASSGTCPIQTKELMDVVVDICDGVLEHMQPLFFLNHTEDVRREIMAVLKPKIGAQYKDQGTFSDCATRLRQPSDAFLKRFIKKNSYPDPAKVQVARGFDFYVDREKLDEIEQRHKDDQVQHRLCARFTLDLIALVAGGNEVLAKGSEAAMKGLMKLAGEDLLEAIYLRSKITFGLDDVLSLKEFRGYVLKDLSHRKRKVLVADKKTGLMASVLFRSKEKGLSLPATPEAEDPPAKPGHNYWLTPSPHRSRLSPRFPFYMEKTKLAEFQRYLGPESFKNIMQHWPDYLKALIQYAAGGEERFLSALLVQMKSGEKLQVLEIDLEEAIYDHVERLFSKSNVKRTNMMGSLKRFRDRQLEVYDRGTTRWHFPDVDERPKPEALILLEEQEYWRKPAPDRTQLRPGHDVYIRTKILDSIASYFGPQSKVNCIKQYSYALLAHMLGGPETTLKLYLGKTFEDGLRSMILFDDLIAASLHCDEVFHLAFSISPTASLVFAATMLVRRHGHGVRKEKRLEKGARTRQPKNLLHFALNV